MSFTYPGQGTTTSTTELLVKQWTNSWADPIIPPPLFYGRQIGGIRKVEVIQGIARQGILYAEGAPPVEQLPGDTPTGQIAARAEYTISRQDSWITKTHQLRYNEMVYVPSAIARVNSFVEIERRMVEGEMDRRLCRLLCKAAREGSLSSQSQFIHGGGTIKFVSGGGATTGAGALAGRYPRNSTGGTNAYNDLGSLADSLDRKNAPRGVGARPLWVSVDMHNALLEYNDARLFSKDYIDEMVGNNVQRREVSMCLGFTVMGITQLDAGTVSGYAGTSPGYNGGVMPAINFNYGPSNCQGNFLPGASTGTPAAVGAFRTPGEAQPVEYWEEYPLSRHTEDKPLLKQITFHTSMLPQHGIGNPAGAYSVEVGT